MLPEGLRCGRRRRGWRSSRGELEWTGVTQRWNDRRTVGPGVGAPAKRNKANKQTTKMANKQHYQNQVAIFVVIGLLVIVI